MKANREVESKILEVDFDVMCKNLNEIWAEQAFFRQRFTAIWMQNALGEKFRMREETEGEFPIQYGAIKLEHKEILSSEGGVKIADETPPVIIDDIEKGINFFQKIGFYQISKSVKKRTAYILDLQSEGKWKPEIVIDEYSDLDGLTIPAFIEIEAINREVIVQVAELLGYTEADLKDRGARTLVLYYWKE